MTITVPPRMGGVRDAKGASSLCLPGLASGAVLATRTFFARKLRPHNCTQDLRPFHTPRIHSFQGQQRPNTPHGKQIQKQPWVFSSSPRRGTSAACAELHRETRRANGRAQRGLCPPQVQRQEALWQGRFAKGCVFARRLIEAQEVSEIRECRYCAQRSRGVDRRQGQLHAVQPAAGAQGRD